MEITKVGLSFIFIASPQVNKFIDACRSAEHATIGLQHDSCQNNSCLMFMAFVHTGFRTTSNPLR